MCFETMIASLALDIESSVSFGGDNPDPLEVVQAYKHPRDTRVNLWISTEAQRLYRNAEKIDIKSQITRIGNCKATRLSALREAVRLLAKDQIEEIDETPAELAFA